MRTYLLIVGLLLSTVLSAQTTEDCYREFRSIGITYLNNKEFANAFSAFVSAIRCPELPEDDDIDLWFKRVVDAEKAFYEQLIEEAKVSERAAVVAQKEAEEAQERERKARLQAELNAEEAKRRGRRAESLRLSLLAENELQKGNREDALLLSFLAMQLNDQDSVFSQMRIFSEVVKDSFSRVVYTSKEPIQSISSLQSGKEILVTDRTEICLLTLDGQQKEKIWPRSLQRIIGISSMTDGRSSIVYSDNFEAALISDGKHFTMLELPHEAPIISATLDKSNNYILTCARDRQAKLWGIKDKTEVTLAGHLGNVYQGGFSPDGSTIFTRSSDGTIKLWNREGANKGTLSGVYFYDATFAPDQEELVAASAVGDILITDLDGKIKRTLDGHSKPVHSVVFSSDGQYLLSSSSAEVLIWQLPDYQKVASIDHDQEIVGGCLLADDS
ncbi:MAG: WD40 repeat domain-containing protein, partial [Lewinella sp.]|nr:WD40 repeat domain-containing protein [Lewinella sp.]